MRPKNLATLGHLRVDIFVSIYYNFTIVLNKILSSSQSNENTFCELHTSYNWRGCAARRRRSEGGLAVLTTGGLVTRGLSRAHIYGVVATSVVLAIKCRRTSRRGSIVEFDGDGDSITGRVRIREGEDF